jgi:hypothetical protein
VPLGERKIVEIKIRLYPSRDGDIISWLEQFDRQPYGIKTHAVREALRRGIEAQTTQNLPAPTDLSPQSLVTIRQVVEMAVASALSGSTCAPGSQAAVSGSTPAAMEADDRTEDLLDALGKALLLRDEQ